MAIVCLPFHYTCFSFYASLLMSCVIISFCMVMAAKETEPNMRTLWVSMITTVFGVWVPQLKLKSKFINSSLSDPPSP